MSMLSNDQDAEQRTRLILRPSKHQSVEVTENLMKKPDDTVVDKPEPVITDYQKIKISAVDWNNTYSLDIPEIDEQHKTLFTLINELWEAIANRVSVENQLPLIGKLENYTLTHFSQEESFMRDIKYPKFNAHKKMHEQFAERIADEKARVFSGNGFSLDILYFLKDWLINHISIADKDYANFLKAGQSKFSIVRFFKRLIGRE